MKIQVLIDFTCDTYSDDGLLREVRVALKSMLKSYHTEAKVKLIPLFDNDIKTITGFDDE